MVHSKIVMALSGIYGCPKYVTKKYVYFKSKYFQSLIKIDLNPINS